jgi:hypothetical protein
MTRPQTTNSNKSSTTVLSAQQIPGAFVKNMYSEVCHFRWLGEVIENLQLFVTQGCDQNLANRFGGRFSEWISRPLDVAQRAWFSCFYTDQSWVSLS